MDTSFSLATAMELSNPPVTFQFQVQRLPPISTGTEIWTWWLLAAPRFIFCLETATGRFRVRLLIGLTTEWLQSWSGTLRVMAYPISWPSMVDIRSYGLLPETEMDRSNRESNMPRAMDLKPWLLETWTATVFRTWSWRMQAQATFSARLQSSSTNWG